MAKIQTMSQLIAYLVGSNYPEELKTAVTDDMQAVEECNHGGATAYGKSLSTTKTYASRSTCTSYLTPNSPL